MQRPVCNFVGSVLNRRHIPVCRRFWIANPGKRYSGYCGKNAAQNLFAGHLERENQDWRSLTAVLDCGLNHESALTDTGSCADLNYLACVYTACRKIEAANPSRQAQEIAGPRAFPVETIKQRNNRASDHSFALADCPTAEFQQTALGSVQNLKRFFALVRRAGDRGRADVDQLPQQRLVLDDLDILLDRQPPRKAVCQV